MAPDQATEVESPIDHIVVTDKGVVNVDHDTPEDDLAEAGFDHTDFGDAQVFEELLATFDLSPRVETRDRTPQYAKVTLPGDESDQDAGLYVWANEDVALITGNNPITGEYRIPNARTKDTGYASYIGISGKQGAVNELYDAIKRRAKHYKEGRPNERAFI